MTPQISRLVSALVVAATLAFSTLSALASEVRDWDAAAFAAAQADNKAIVIHVTAPWCSTCRAQKPVVDALAASSEYADLVVFDVDFDSRKDVLNSFGVRHQSTLIAFRGSSEVARSVGDTRKAGITALFAATK